jgi:sporulation-control protein spo0M
MENTLTITVTIKNKDGEIITSRESERMMPYIEEIEKQGFRTAFHDMETAILESRKEASEQALSSYIEEISKKKL